MSCSRKTRGSRHESCGFNSGGHSTAPCFFAVTTPRCRVGTDTCFPGCCAIAGVPWTLEPAGPLGILAWWQRRGGNHDAKCRAMLGDEWEASSRQMGIPPSVVAGRRERRVFARAGEVLYQAASSRFARDPASTAHGSKLVSNPVCHQPSEGEPMKQKDYGWAIRIKKSTGIWLTGAGKVPPHMSGHSVSVWSTRKAARDYLRAHERKPGDRVVKVHVSYELVRCETL